MRKFFTLAVLVVTACAAACRPPARPTLIVLRETPFTNNRVVPPYLVQIVGREYVLGFERGGRKVELVGVPLIVASNTLPYPVLLQTNIVTRTNVVTVTNRAQAEVP